jgi:glycosyltransferase involved in cell wall biosynthesis
MTDRKKVKILRIITRLNVGGPSIHTILLSAYLNSDRFETILVKGREGDCEGDMQDLLRKKNIHPIIIPELSREISFVRDWIAFRKLYKLMCREKPDIVHSHLAKAGALVRVAAKLAGVPIIIHTFHGHLFHSYFGYFKTKLLILMERVLACFSTKLIAVSGNVKKEILEKYKICNSSKISFIPLGLELDQFLNLQGEKGNLRRELNLSDEVPLIGIVARLVPIKGHQYFLRAAKEIIKTHPSAKFLIVGDGELRGQLEDLSRQLATCDNVIFCGFRKDLTKIYADLDVVVLSSLNEGLPVTVIEALAAAKPVVATDVGGTGDLIENKITGLLVPPRNSKALAEGILYLLNNPEEGIRMGKNGQQKVYPALNHTRLVEDIEKLYIELLNKKKNKPSL